MNEDEFKTLNEPIIPTCWDVVFSMHFIDGCNLCECGGGAASYDLWQVSIAYVWFILALFNDQNILFVFLIPSPSVGVKIE
jgi:hypothetical protein